MENYPTQNQSQTEPIHASETSSQSREINVDVLKTENVLLQKAPETAAAPSPPSGPPDGPNKVPDEYSKNSIKSTETAFFEPISIDTKQENHDSNVSFGNSEIGLNSEVYAKINNQARSMFTGVSEEDVKKFVNSVILEISNNIKK